MSQVIKDIEEALKREVASIISFHQATKTNTTLKTTFDPFTGEPIQTPFEASFYDETSTPNAVTYPRFDLSFDSVVEDRTSGRMISIWEDYLQNYQQIIEPNKNRPQVYKQIVSGRDGTNVGDGLVINAVNLSKINSDNLVKIINGNNQGTYKINSLDSQNLKVILDSTLVDNIQELSYNENTKKIYLLNSTDLFAVRTGDIFVDASGSEFKINYVNTKKRELQIQTTTTPDLSIGASIRRDGDVLRNSDSEDLFYIVMDKDKPIESVQFPGKFVTDEYLNYHHPTPFNYFYTLKVKNNKRQAHTEIAERITETIMNRPRRAIQILLRCDNSAETDVTCGSKNGDGFTVQLESVKDFCVNDSVWFTNKFKVSENNQIIDIDSSNNTIVLRNRVPTEFDGTNKAKLVSNAILKLWSFFIIDGTANISEDNINNFYRQTYQFRIEGWKAEKSGELITRAISQIKGTIKTPNLVEEDF